MKLWFSFVVILGASISGYSTEDLKEQSNLSSKTKLKPANLVVVNHDYNSHTCLHISQKEDNDTKYTFIKVPLKNKISYGSLTIDTGACLMFNHLSSNPTAGNSIIINSHISYKAKQPIELLIVDIYHNKLQLTVKQQFTILYIPKLVQNS